MIDLRAKEISGNRFLMPENSALPIGTVCITPNEIAKGSYELCLEDKYSIHLTRTANNPSALDEALGTNDEQVKTHNKIF